MWAEGQSQPTVRLSVQVVPALLQVDTRKLVAPHQAVTDQGLSKGCVRGLAWFLFGPGQVSRKGDSCVWLPGAMPGCWEMSGPACRMDLSEAQNASIQWVHWV